MKQAQINIIGQIGRAPEEPIEGTITLLEIVPKVRTAIDAGADTLLVGILSPGGYVDEGNAIYDYLMSLKKDRLENGKTVKGLAINTTTIPDPITGKGLVGSIATKAYLAGDERTVSSMDDFFIHNPWMNPGPSDSKQLFDSYEAALKAEEELKAFYCAVTKNTPEALSPFMDAETSFTGSEAVKFGFATKIKNKVPLLAKVKMDKSKKTMQQLFTEVLAKIKGGKMKADLNITDQAGVGYFIDNDAVTDPMQASGSAIFLANPDGTPTTTPAPDGDITTADGLVVSVSAGLISAVKQATAMTNQELATKVAALEKSNGELTTSVTQLLEALKAKPAEMITNEQLEAKLAEKILALKKEISSTHVPQRTKAERKKAEKEGLRALGPIALKMRYPKGVPAEVQKLLDED